MAALAGEMARAEADLTDPDVAVEEGHDALGTPRWFDAKADDFRPLYAKPPKPTRNWNFGNWSFLFGGWIRFLMWLLFAALLLLIVYLLTKSFLRRESSQLAEVDGRSRAPIDEARVEELPLTLSTPPEDYLEAAHRHYRRGEFGPAILYLFSHQLLELDRWHWIYLIKGKTNRQYVREVTRAQGKPRDELAGLLNKTVLLFEEVYFGKRIPPRPAIDEVWGLIDRFETLVTQTTGEPGV
jgi:hypothetical protein